VLQILYSVGGFIVAVSILVTFHELGHFVIARIFGVKILRFSIGFGKPLWRRCFGADKTEFVIGLIPLGGYVRMLDEREVDVIDAECDAAFNRQSLLVRCAIVVAGPFANFLLAVLLYWIALVVGIAGFSPVIGQVLEDGNGAKLGFKSGEQIVAIDKRPVHSWGEYHVYMVNQSLKGQPMLFDIRSDGGVVRSIEVDPNDFPNRQYAHGALEMGLGLFPTFPPIPPTVSEVLAGSPAQKGGLHKGDVVTAVDGSPIGNWGDLVEAISNRPGQLVELAVDRAEQQIVVELIPDIVEEDTKVIGRIGIKRDVSFRPTTSLQLNLLPAFVRGVENTWLITEVTVRTLVNMVQLKISTETLGGPVTIARVAGRSARTGVVPFLLFLAVVSVSLGILNLLPIPILDGGHLLYLLIEAIRGVPVSAEAMQFGQRLGIGMLAVLMFIAFYNDVTHFGF
jgi:regulator of sigma E protease